MAVCDYRERCDIIVKTIRVFAKRVDRRDSNVLDLIDFIYDNQPAFVNYVLRELDPILEHFRAGDVEIIYNPNYRDKTFEQLQVDFYNGVMDCMDNFYNSAMTSSRQSRRDDRHQDMVLEGPHNPAAGWAPNRRRRQSTNDYYDDRRDPYGESTRNNNVGNAYRERYAGRNANTYPNARPTVISTENISMVNETHTNDNIETDEEAIRRILNSGKVNTTSPQFEVDPVIKDPFLPENHAGNHKNDTNIQLHQVPSNQSDNGGRKVGMVFSPADNNDFGDEGIDINTLSPHTTLEDAYKKAESVVNNMLAEKKNQSNTDEVKGEVIPHTPSGTIDPTLVSDGTYELLKLIELTEEVYMKYLEHELNEEERRRYQGLPTILDEVKNATQAAESVINDSGDVVSIITDTNYQMSPMIVPVHSPDALKGIREYNQEMAKLGKVVIKPYHDLGDITGFYLKEATDQITVRDFFAQPITTPNLNEFALKCMNSSNTTLKAILRNVEEKVGKWVDSSVKFKIGGNNDVVEHRLQLTGNFMGDLTDYLFKTGYKDNSGDVALFLINTLGSLEYFMPKVVAADKLDSQTVSPTLTYSVSEDVFSQIFYLTTPFVDVTLPFDLTCLRVKLAKGKFKESYRADESDNKTLFKFYKDILSVVKTVNKDVEKTDLYCQDIHGNVLVFKPYYAQSAYVSLSYQF